MREGVPLGAAGRYADYDQIGGMHGLPGVRGGLSGERYARAVAIFKSAWDSGAGSSACDFAGLGDGGGDCGAVLRRRLFCQDDGPLGFACDAGNLSATGSECRRGGASHAGGKLRLAAVGCRVLLEKNYCRRSLRIKGLAGNSRQISGSKGLICKILCNKDLWSVLLDFGFQSSTVGMPQ